MYIIFGILIFLILVFLVYILVFIRPRKKHFEKNLCVEYAHRGLHGKNVPENSIMAFKKAVDEGVGIELDVQLSKDGTVMVFHDYTLIRMTGLNKKLSELTLEELKELSLKDTSEKIPTFKEVLELVDKKVPLLIELKGESLDSSLCPKVYEELKNYSGPYCIESFNPLLIRDIKKYLPDCFCGQLYTNVVRDKKKATPLNIILTLMAFNFLAKPDFIAFNKEDRTSLPVKITTGLYKAPKFVWTVKNENELTVARKNDECAIFEREM